MRRRRLGEKGPDISVIGYGAWEAGGTAWGPNESEDVVIEAIRAALDAGIDWIDTAEVYGDGVSERLVGRAVSGRRDDLTIASKVAPTPEGSGFRPEQGRGGVRWEPPPARDGPDRPLPAALARRDRRSPRGHLGRDDGAPRRREGPIHRCLELRPRGDRAVPPYPSRGFAAAGVLDARAQARGADPVVRRRGRRRGQLRAAGLRPADRRGHGGLDVPRGGLASQAGERGPVRRPRGLARDRREAPPGRRPGGGVRCPSSRSPGTSIRPA
jgi:Aldo/keto reductase family